MQNNIINEKLVRAVNDENLEEVKALLSAGADAKFRIEELSSYSVSSYSGNTLLHDTNSAKIAKELLLGGVVVNTTNSYRETPLHWAITHYQKLEKVTELLKHGADVNASDRKGNTALNLAVRRSLKDLELIKELLKYGADINIRNRENKDSYRNDKYSTPLDNALGAGLDYAKLLVKFTLIINKDYKNIIDLDPYTEWPIYNELSSYLADCVCEVNKMKTDELPLYEFVTNNFNNNQLSEKLAKIDFSMFCVRYPIYNDIILDKMKTLKRADLLNKLKLSQIQCYTKLATVNQDVKEKKIVLDYYSTCKITEYLSNNDLLNFIVVFDDSSNRDIQSSSSFNNLVEPESRLCEASTSNDAKRPRLE